MSRVALASSRHGEGQKPVGEWVVAMRPAVVGDFERLYDRQVGTKAGGVTPETGVGARQGLGNPGLRPRVTGKPCARCGEQGREGGQAYCQPCTALRQQAYRARKRGGGAVVGVWAGMKRPRALKGVPAPRPKVEAGPPAGFRLMRCRGCGGRFGAERAMWLCGGCR